MIRPGTICRESNFMKSLEKNKKDDSPYKSQKLDEDSVVCEDSARQIGQEQFEDEISRPKRRY